MERWAQRSASKGLPCEFLSISWWGVWFLVHRLTYLRLCSWWGVGSLVRLSYLGLCSTLWAQQVSSLTHCHGFWSPWFDSGQSSPNTLSKGRGYVMQSRKQLDATCGMHMVHIIYNRCFNYPLVGIYCLCVAGGLGYGCFPEIPFGGALLWGRECGGSMEASQVLSTCCSSLVTVCAGHLQDI